MEKRDKHKDLLFDNRLRRIENRLRKIEILFLKNINKDKKITQELQYIEKEEKKIEHEQKKLETEEKAILKDMIAVEEEEKWHMEVQYNCKLKVMDVMNVIKCDKTKKGCELMLCPLWKKK
jgi:hypothetical protein